MTAAGTGPSPQSVISENLKILPLLLLGLLKHVSTYLKLFSKKDVANSVLILTLGTESRWDLKEYQQLRALFRVRTV